MTNKNDQLANSVASGIARNQMDQGIGALILMAPIGFLIPQTAFIGIPLLLLLIWMRNSV